MEEEQTLDGYPLLVAENTGTKLKVWCKHCAKYHFHGQGIGYRVAHCDDTTSPHKKTGYILVTKLPDKKEIPGK